MKKRNIITLFLSFFVTTTLFAQTPTYISDEGLVAWWPFNGNSEDESGNGYDGWVNGADLSTDRFGNINNSFSFSNGDYISILDTPPLRLSNTDFTISSWVYLTDTLPTSVGFGGYVILNKRDTNNSTPDYNFSVVAPSYTVDYKAGSPMFSTSNSVGCFNMSPYQLKLHEWTNVLASYVFNTGTLNIYINGNLVSSISGVPAPGMLNTANIWIGNDVTNLPYHFHGKLDDIAIWNRKLTQNEILNVYNSISTEVISTQNKPKIKAYPNPSSQELTIDFGDKYYELNRYTLKIENSMGQDVFLNFINSQKIKIEISNFSDGIYFAHIIDNENKTFDSVKFVVQKN